MVSAPDPKTELFWLPLDLSHTRVVSGRLAGRVLTWPARTKDGLRLRDCFPAPPGWMYGSWDLSQIELRLAAGFSQDKLMLKAFWDGLDLHQQSASALFGVPYEQVDKLSQRTPTKTVSYLVLYGGGEDKLFTELKIMGVQGFDRPASGKIIRDWLELYEGLDRYITRQTEKSRARGYAETWTGRRRYLPGMNLIGRHWPCSKLREEAERQGFNMEIQGGAQDLLKECEVRVMEVKKDLNAMGVGFEPCLQLHDEVVALVKKEHWEVTNSFMRAAMQDGVVRWGVPLECEGKMADTWGGLK